MKKSTIQKLTLLPILTVFLISIRPGLVAAHRQVLESGLQVTNQAGLAPGFETFAVRGQAGNPLEAVYSYAYLDEMSNIWLKLVGEPEPFQITFRKENQGHFSTIQWSPDGSKLAYLQNLSQNTALGDPTNLHVYDLAVRMEQEFGVDIFDYDWSPDSREIIYTRSFDFEYSYADNTYTFQKADGVWRLDLATGATQELVPAAGYPLTQAEVSPSGRYIVYRESLDFNANLWNLKIFDTENPTAVTELDFKGDCAWSPVKDQLACTEGAGFNYPLDASKLPCATVLVSPQGNQLEKLPVLTEDNCDLSLDWAPDGQTLLINTRRFVRPNNLGDVSDLYFFDTQTRMALETSPLSGSWTPDSAWLEYSKWSSEQAAFSYSFRNIQTGEAIAWQGRTFWQPAAAEKDDDTIAKDAPAERLYFLENGDLFFMEPPSPQKTNLTSGENYAQFEVSTGGEHLLAVERILQTQWQYNLDLISTSNGSKIEIGEITVLRNQFPSLSLDGTKLLYTLSENPNGVPDGKTIITDLSGKKIVETPFLMRFAHWGSDSEIYYFRENHTSESVVSFNRFDVDTREEKEVYSYADLNSAEYPFYPDSVYYSNTSPFLAVWSKKIIQTDSGELVFLSLDSSFEIQRTRLYSCRMDNRIGVWDEKGEIFLFSEGQSGEWSSPNYVYVSTTRFHGLALNRPAYLNPSISPAGDQIAYVTVNAGLGLYGLDDRLYQQIIEDLDPNLLGSAPGDCRGPMPKGYPAASVEAIWSASGNWIAFTRGPGVYLVDPRSGYHAQYPDGENFRWAPRAAVTAGDDQSPPAVTNLQIKPVSAIEYSQIEFSWTVPVISADQLGEPIRHFDLRYSHNPITEETWEDAIPVESQIEAAEAGAEQVWKPIKFEVKRNTRHYFAIKGRTENSGWSLLSNVTLLIDSGFRHHPDGYSFLNYDPDEVKRLTLYEFTTADLEKMFERDEVCEPSIQSHCEPTVLGERFLQEVNSSYGNGVCFGMASTSLTLFLNPNVIREEFPEIDFYGVYPSLGDDNERVNSYIAYYQATAKTKAYMEELTKQFRENEPSDLFLSIRDYLLGITQEPMILVFYDPKENGGVAHAVTPIALSLKSLEEDWWILHIYDSNLPLHRDSERYFEFNLSENIWRSSGGAYTSSQSDMALIPLSLIYQEKQELPYPPKGQTRVWSSDQTIIIISNEQNQRLGYIDSQFIHEIPDAIVIPEIGSPAGFVNPVYYLPSDSLVNFSISSDRSGKVSFNHYSDHRLTSLTGSTPNLNAQIDLAISADGQSLTLSSNEQFDASFSLSQIGSETRTIHFNDVGIEDGTIIYLTEVDHGQAFTIQHTDTKDLAYELKVNMRDASGMDDYTLPEQILHAGETHKVVTDNWAKNGEITLQIDKNSDGIFDESIVLQNADHEIARGTSQSRNLSRIGMIFLLVGLGIVLLGFVGIFGIIIYVRKRKPK